MVVAPSACRTALAFETEAAAAHVCARSCHPHQTLRGAETHHPPQHAPLLPWVRVRVQVLALPSSRPAGPLLAVGAGYGAAMSLQPCPRWQAAVMVVQQHLQMVPVNTLCA